MARHGQRDLGKERFWRRLVSGWRRSGLSIRDYCDHHQVSEASFYAWRRTLAARDAAACRSCAPAARVGEAAHDTPAFVPVRVVQPPAKPAAGLELVLGNGRVLRLGSGFDPQVLRQLLALLEEPSC
jgi:transposase